MDKKEFTASNFIPERLLDIICILENVERTGAVVKPRTLGREVPDSSPPVAVRCGLEQVTYPQLLR